MLQYRLRTMFIAMTAVAVLAWALFAPPKWLGLLAISLIYLLFAQAKIAGIVYHRGHWQSFFIGMTPWVAVVLYAVALLSMSIALSGPPVNDDLFSLFTAAPDDLVFYKSTLAIPIFLAVVSGLVAVGIRW